MAGPGRIKFPVFKIIKKRGGGGGGSLIIYNLSIFNQ